MSETRDVAKSSRQSHRLRSHDFNSASGNALGQTSPIRRPPMTRLALFCSAGPRLLRLVKEASS